MRNKARVAGVVAAATAGVLFMGAPAFASDHNHEYNGINVGNENNIQVPIGVCNNNVGIAALVVPIASPQSTESCAAAVIDQSS